MTRRPAVQSIAAHSLAILASVIMVIPVYLIVVNSLKTSPEVELDEHRLGRLSYTSRTF